MARERSAEYALAFGGILILPVLLFSLFAFFPFSARASSLVYSSDLGAKLPSELQNASGGGDF